MGKVSIDSSSANRLHFQTAISRAPRIVPTGTDDPLRNSATVMLKSMKAFENEKKEDEKKKKEKMKKKEKKMTMML